PIAGPPCARPGARATLPATAPPCHASLRKAHVVIVINSGQGRRGINTKQGLNTMLRGAKPALAIAKSVEDGVVSLLWAAWDQVTRNGAGLERGMERRLAKIFMQRGCSICVSHRAALDNRFRLANLPPVQRRGTATDCPCLGGFFPGDNVPGNS